MSERPALRRLAERLGVALDYESALTRTRVGVPDETLEQIAAARGHEATSEAAAERALDALEQARKACVLAPLRVVVAGSADATRVPLEGPAGPADATPARAPAEVRAILSTEAGERIELTGRPASGTGGAALDLPPDLPLGYHHVEVAAHAAGEEPARQQLVVVPERAFGPEEALGRASGFGIHANLYAVRGGNRGVGYGSLGELRVLVALAARHGAGYVAVNPLQATPDTTGDASPYAPIDRRHLDPLYLDVEAIPELARCPDARRRLDSAEARHLRDAGALDRTRIWRLLRPLLYALFETFRSEHERPGTERGRAFAAARAEAGDALRDHATFVALAEWHAEQGVPGVAPWDWRTWPATWQAPDAPAVARFRAEHADTVAFHCWLQWELARQLAGVDAEARRAGVALGLCADWPLGSRPGGVETWRHPGLFASGVEAGAPPDEYAREGQTWGFPPLDPGRLVDGAGHEPWLAMLRATLASAGALRLDHVLSLHRLFWVPEGAPASAGAYVHYPEQTLLGLLALESRRHRAVLIGEDLGTVPEGFSERIRSRGLLSTRVLYFERDAEGFRPAGACPARAMVTANTHDLPPLAGWLSGEDIALRRGIGQIDAPTGESPEERDRARARADLEARLHADGHLPAGEPLTAENAVPAVGRFLAASPAVLVGVSLDDLAGETRPINLPGVPETRFPSWTQRLGATPAEIEASPRARETFRALAEAGRTHSTRTPGGGDGPS